MEDILPVRILPELGLENTGFWTSGQDGTLRIEQCRDCGTWIHPATGTCFACQGENVELTAVSGRGTIYSFTVNHQPWFGDIGPYTVVLVDLDEGTADNPVRITSNLVGTDPDEVSIGMTVEIFFIEAEDVWLPQFRAVK
jgi:uncharacterized OB-fold protein